MRAVDLFRIVSGGTVYTLTSAATTQQHTTGPGGSNEDYVPAPIGRGGSTVKNEMSKANMDVRLDLEHALAQDLLARWVEASTVLTVFTKRNSGTDVTWKGRLVSVVPDDDHLKLVFESIYTSMRRPGLRARFQKNCRHALYARGCYVDPVDFEWPGEVQTMTGVVLTIPEAADKEDGYFTGGMIAAPDGTMSYITNHLGDAVTLGRVSSSLGAAFADEGPGLAVLLYPGCDHSYATCRDKFSNEDNYGGFDYIPTKNPMGGSSIV